MEEVKVNSHGVNAKIKAKILSDDEMRRIGFTNYVEERWFFYRDIEFPKEKRYRGFDINFSVTIPKDGSEIRIDVLDEAYGQPFDYQRILENNPNFAPCLMIKEQVEKWMDYLEKSGVLSGHVNGEYI